MARAHAGNQKESKGMASDYLPNDGESFCEWLENWKVEFGAVAPVLNFKPEEAAAVLADADWALYVCRAASDASSHAIAWVHFRESLLSGDGNTPLGNAPASARPAAPESPRPCKGPSRASARRSNASKGLPPTPRPLARRCASWPM